MRAAKESRPPTIRDVARVAGVSLPTVSRVLTGSTPVSEKRRAQVYAAMKELGYRPNGAARALVQGSQPIIGVITPDVTYGSTQMVLAIEQEARDAGYVVTVTVVDPHDPVRMDAALDVLLAQPIVGTVVLDFDRYDLDELMLRLGSVPLSTISSERDERFRRVVVDDRSAARKLTEHLLALGHRTVHHVSFHGPSGHMHPRELGWRDALHAAGAVIPEPIPIDPMLDGDLFVRAGPPSVEQLLRDESVTAVFCANDQIAFGVIRALMDAGLSVPGDVSVVGMDDEPLAEFWPPGLTTYRLDFGWAGAAAVQALLQPESAGRTTTPSTFGLSLRDSSAAPRASRSAPPSG